MVNKYLKNVLTVEKLKAFGANTAEGVARCVNNEAFYLRMVSKAMSDANYGKLEAAIHVGAKAAAFEAAHALKGVLGNLSLTPILEPVMEITELLRSRADANANYEAILERILMKKRELDLLAQ